MLASLLAGGALKFFADSLFGRIAGAWDSYLKKQITEAELKEKLAEAVLASFADVEKQFLDSITKTYTAFIQAAAGNAVMARGWSIVLYSQLFVLIWHQMVIPALATYGIAYKSSGATVDWAYALVALCLGAPAIVQRIGPAASWTGDALKKLVGK